MNQIEIPYQRHSDTSRAAAATVIPKGDCERVLALLRRVGGATDEEMQTILGLDGSTQRPRRVWLHQHGFVEDSGSRRRTCKGRLAVVWRPRLEHTEEIP